MNLQIKFLIYIFVLLCTIPSSIEAQDLTKSESINIDQVNAAKKLYREIHSLNKTLKTISNDSLINNTLSEELSELNKNINIMANAEETKVVENTETKSSDSNWQIWIPIIISIAALIIAFVANQISRDSNKLSIQANTLANQANDIYKNELALTHRPYVWIENHAFIDDKNNSVNDPNTVQLIVINSPARVTSESHYHFMKKGDEIIEIEKKEYNNRILYPSEKMQYTFTVDQIAAQKVNDLLENGYELFRESKVKYQMLSSKEEYIYEAKWNFEKAGKSWQLTENPIAN